MNQTGRTVRVPKDNTRTTILTYLLGQDLSALDLEEKIGINESAIRRHLQILEENGFIEHYFKKAKRGRPKKLYSITSAGRDLFPKKNDLLLRSLVKKLEKEYGETAVSGLMKKVAKSLKKHLSLPERNGNPKERLEALVNAFDKLGFFPALSKEGDTYVISFRHCIFDGKDPGLAKYLCMMHKQLIREVLGDIEILQTSSLCEEGGEVCRHEISFKKS